MAVQSKISIAAAGACTSINDYCLLTNPLRPTPIMAANKEAGKFYVKVSQHYYELTDDFIANCVCPGDLNSAPCPLEGQIINPCPKLRLCEVS